MTTNLCDSINIATLDNSSEALERFIASDQFNQLEAPERNFLSRYRASVLDQSISADKLVELSGIRDASLGKYPGGGSVKDTIKEMYSTGIEINYYITNRPFVFFHQQDGHSYFFKNPEAKIPTDIQLLDLTAGCWRQVKDLTAFEGTVDKNGGTQYDGLIKAHDLIVYFNQNTTVKDSVETVSAQETIEMQEPTQLYYHEEQTSGFCQIHAMNAFLGYRAVVPSKLQEFDIENGIDLGVLVDYLIELQSTDQLKVDIRGLELGSVKFINDELVFHSTQSQKDIVIDQRFLDLKTRCMFGTYAPAHARTLRKNVDGTWNLIDSFDRIQPFKKVEECLKEHIKSQRALSGGNIALPIIFL